MSFPSPRFCVSTLFPVAATRLLLRHSALVDSFYVVGMLAWRWAGEKREEVEREAQSNSTETLTLPYSPCPLSSVHYIGHDLRDIGYLPANPRSNTLRCAKSWRRGTTRAAEVGTWGMLEWLELARLEDLRLFSPPLHFIDFFHLSSTHRFRLLSGTDLLL